MNRPKLNRALSRTNYDESIINTMEVLAKKSGFKNLTKKYTTTIANQILESYSHVANFKVDRYIRYNPESSDPYNKIEVKSSLPENALDENWTPLIPGDIIYYPCAFGVQLAEHFGVYIGMGFVIHVWCENDCVLPGFIKALKKIATFDTKDEPPNGYVLMTKLKHFTPGSRSDCSDKNIYVYDPSKYAFSRHQIIRNAIESIGDFEYNILESDCQTFALKCATGNVCHKFRNKNAQSKELQQTRIYDARVHLQPDEFQGLSQDQQHELDQQVLVALQGELINPADKEKAKQLFIRFSKNSN
jgi:hypothetical protein